MSRSVSRSEALVHCAAGDDGVLVRQRVGSEGRANVPAGVQHVGHEGDGVGAARRVHHVDHHTGEGRGLRDQTVR